MDVNRSGDGGTRATTHDSLSIVTQTDGAEDSVLGVQAPDNDAAPHRAQSCPGTSDHRSTPRTDLPRADARGGSAPGVILTATTLTTSLVLALQTVRGYPCVSLLLRTRPGERMDDADLVRLHHLADQALDRLDASGQTGRGSQLSRTLHDLIEAASTARTSISLGLFASRAMGRSVLLGVDVEDRAVVDHTFATRDLVRALHRTPRHVVLVLERHRVRLLDGAAGELRPAPTGGFPLHSTIDLTGRQPEEDRRAFLETVDRRLGTYRALHPCPLVVLGAPTVVRDYLRLARHAGRLAGTLDLDDVPTSVAGLRARIRPLLASYLGAREREAMELLERREGEFRVASGVQAAWSAARRERPEMLVVEPGLMVPARLSRDGDTLTVADQVGEPDVIDDIVDELIELVLARGGWVAFAHDGALTAHDGVALTIR